jgi:ATP-binding cassette subfamily C protein CydD
LIPVKAATVLIDDRIGMTTLATDRAARRGRLAAIAPAAARLSGVVLIADTIAAIGFAGGLAGAVSALAGGRRRLAGWAALMLASAVARGVLTMMAARHGSRIAAGAKIGLRGRIVHRALARMLGGGTTAGQLVNAVTHEVEAIDGYVAYFLPARVAAMVAPLVVLGSTAIASPVSATILITTLIPFIAAMALAGGAAADQSRRQFTAMARLSGLFADRLRALPLILAFRAEARETQRIGRASADVARRTMGVLRIAFLSNGALEFFAALSVALVAVYAGFNLLRILPFEVPETLDLPRAFFVLALAPEFYAPMRRLAAAYHDRQQAESATERLDVTAPPAPAPARAALPAAAPAITFENVAIRYPDAIDDAVARVSFAVPPGKTLALVGPSGSGKSSLLNLLLGLAPITSGRVTVDERDLADLTPIAGWTGQAPLLVVGTIAENIALAAPHASRAAIAGAAEAAGLGPALAARPAGLDAPLDQRGGGLSGGERRRIGLARALLKGAPLLLLDEPTAHLDSAAEAALIETIRRACAGRTTIIATHSAALVAIADHVIDLGRAR